MFLMSVTANGKWTWGFRRGDDGILARMLLSTDGRQRHLAT